MMGAAGASVEPEDEQVTQFDIYINRTSFIAKSESSMTAITLTRVPVLPGLIVKLGL